MFASTFAIVLVVAFNGDTHLLIPLYAAGVFLSFTLAQGGMVIHWRRKRCRSWMRKALINGAGAAVTALVFAIIVSSNFLAGAWISLLAIGCAAWAMNAIFHHYQNVKKALGLNDNERAKRLLLAEAPKARIIIPAYAINKPFIKTLNYARGLSDNIEVYHVKVSAQATRRFKADYQKLEISIPLVIEKAPYRNVNEVLLDHIDEKLGELEKHETLTIVIPQLVTKIWQMPLHNQTTLMLESALVGRRNVAMVTIPYLIDS